MEGPVTVAIDHLHRPFQVIRLCNAKHEASCSWFLLYFNTLVTTTLPYLAAINWRDNSLTCHTVTLSSPCMHAPAAETVLLHAYSYNNYRWL